MNELIIICNPKKNSFCHAIATEVKKASLRKGIKVKTRDLYDMNFNPLLTEKELLLMDNCEYAADVTTEHNYIRWADVITFIYPMWWASMPAMLKGYIDRVICKNFAYCYTDEGIKGLLTNKKVILFTPYGNSQAYYKATGMFSALKRTIDEAIFNFCGMKILSHTYFGSIHKVDDATRNDYLTETNLLIKRLL